MKDARELLQRLHSFSPSEHEMMRQRVSEAIQEGKRVLFPCVPGTVATSSMNLMACWGGTSEDVEAHPLQAVRNALTPTGTLIPNSGRGGRWVGPLGRFVKARVRSLVTRQTLKPFTSVQKRQDLRTLAGWLEAGELTPVIDRTYRLSAAADALRYVGAGHTRGKVVITV